jgi:hypothetical protein
VVLVLESVVPAERDTVATDESSWRSEPPAPQRVSRVTHIGVIERLGYPRAEVVLRCGAQRCLPKSWLAASSGNGSRLVESTRATSAPAFEGAAGVDESPMSECSHRDEAAASLRKEASLQPN